MPPHRKFAQYRAAGCKICGDKTVGRGIAKHVDGAHSVKYAAYKACFKSGKTIVDRLEATGTVAKGKKGKKKVVVVHVLVRRFTV